MCYHENRLVFLRKTFVNEYLSLRKHERIFGL